MTEHDDCRHDNRRDEDHFYDCPKYIQHDLTREQIKEIVEEVYKQMKADAFDEGKSAIVKVITFLGIAAYSLYAWLSNHPFK
jgi:hypothetical protein